MKIVIETPTKAFIVESSIDEMNLLRSELTYSHTGNAFLLKRHYDNHWLRRSNITKWNKTLEDLKNKQKFTLVFEENGRQYIRPGSIPYLKTLIKMDVENRVIYPKAKKIAWHKPLPFDLYPYQEEGWQQLLEEKHGNVSYCTGAGKTACILKLCRELGLKTAIVVPSKSIFLEVLKQFENHFGKGKVGTFGNGKKKIGKQFTICISDSIVNIKPESEEWLFFNSLDALVFDESHTIASETLEEICHKILEKVPYRFFLSATQTRGDGTLKLLQSIIGRTVNTLSTKEAVGQGYICPHDYTIVELESSNPNLDPRDPLEQKRAHFLRNRNIGAFIAKFCNSIIPINGQQVLVLVEELDQVAFLAKELKVPFAYAHSESKKERLLELGLEKVDPEESVEKFNKGEAKVLIGTSCIATGTNIYPVNHCFNWVGGTSEIKTKQGAIGRSIRKLSSSPWADKCVSKPKATIYDFCIRDSDLMKKHLAERIGFYQESGSEIKFIKLK